MPFCFPPVLSMHEVLEPQVLKVVCHILYSPLKVYLLESTITFSGKSHHMCNGEAISLTKCLSKLSITCFPAGYIYWKVPLHLVKNHTICAMVKPYL